MSQPFGRVHSENRFGPQLRSAEHHRNRRDEPRQLYSDWRSLFRRERQRLARFLGRLLRRRGAAMARLVTRATVLSLLLGRENVRAGRAIAPQRSPREQKRQTQAGESLEHLFNDTMRSWAHLC